MCSGYPEATCISRDNWHKRRKTGGKRKPYHKKRKYELGRPPANTKIGPRRIHTVRVRGGNKKYRALRLDVGNFSWGSECCTRKTRIIDVVYNASNNELVRTKTLVKNCSLRHSSRTQEGSQAGISRDNWHKRRKTGGKRKPYHKRKYELGRPPANTKIGPRRIHTVRVRGGNKKYRALRLDVGNFSWGSECCTRKTRIIDVVYNASNNELVRTKTLVKNCILLIDSLPFRQWYEAHYATPLGRKKGAKLSPEEEEVLNKKRSKKTQKKYDERKKTAKISTLLEEQFQQGKLLACIASRPGQCGRADGYILEGKELEFYLRKIKAKKGK
ncbi:small ribosomal subunit protein eS8-like [Cololabis saira]|uniref:small ribosomal subunit protein eS8-like n=1 Tax=Cololabis saira TaxID=129043 RepID=UPI002AD4CC5C|nr:small ribosomal subunit protein eS8-like [Cololabis saira]